MLVVREVFKAKPGQASKLAKLFKKVFGNDLKTRVMTDFIGKYNTVEMEMQVKTLAVYEKLMEDYKSGKIKRKLDKKTADEMSKYTDMFISGKREVYQIV